MFKGPKISVVIPVYNVADYLSRCLESLRCQSLLDIEIICVNDGSTDNSAEIIEKQMKADGRILLINKKNAVSSIIEQNIIARNSAKVNI